MAPPIATSSLNGSHEAGDVARNGVKRAAHESSLDAFHASSTHDAMHTEAEYAAHNYHPLPVVFSRAKGCTVWDPEGNSYLDFLSAYSAVNQGHCHPELIKTMTEQAQRLTLSSRAFYNDVFPRFAEHVTKMFGFDMVLPMCTGAEAVETAIKISRKWGYKEKGIPLNEALVFSVRENFHGRTFSAITMSTDPESRDNYGPYLPNLGSVCPATGKTLYFDSVPDIRAALEAHGPKTAAIIIEPIQGEAGIVVPSDTYLRSVKTLCEEHNVLLICDEIQTGIARTGKLLCHEYSGIKPDLVTLGKALSGGMYPVSCVLGSKDLMLTVEPGTHGSTFGGNPLGSAIAIRALQLIREENMVQRAAELGERFRHGLHALHNPIIATVRGKGLLNAVVIDETKTNGHSAWDLCMLLKNKGLLVGRALKVAHVRHVAATPAGTTPSHRTGPADERVQAKPTHQNIIRLAPPLVITDEEIDRAVRIFGQAMDELPGLTGRKEDEVIPPPEKGVSIGVDN